MSRLLDVAWSPTELDGSMVPAASTIVVDVIRATTSLTTALAAGARSVVPVASVQEARDVAGTECALLCGERGGFPPDGFDLGNSPADFTRARVADRTLVFTTTNGTAVMRVAGRLARGALRLACFRNLGAVTAAIVADVGGDARHGVLIVCSGRRGRVSMDDAWCAGHLVESLLRAGLGLEPTDGAVAARELAAGLGAPSRSGLARTAAGRALGKLGLAGDLTDCARSDDLAVVPVWREGAFVTGGEEDRN